MRNRVTRVMSHPVPRNRNRVIGSGTPGIFPQLKVSFPTVNTRRDFYRKKVSVPLYYTGAIFSATKVSAPHTLQQHQRQFSGIHYTWQYLHTGLLVSPIHSVGIHHDKCSSLSKLLLPTTPAGYTNVHVSGHRLPISVCSAMGSYF